MAAFGEARVCLSLVKLTECPGKKPNMWLFCESSFNPSEHMTIKDFIDLDLGDLKDIITRVSESTCGIQLKNISWFDSAEDYRCSIINMGTYPSIRILLGLYGISAEKHEIRIEFISHEVDEDEHSDT